MPQNQLWGRAIVLATIVLCIAFAVAASGEQGKPAGAAFATVDINKVSTDFKAKAVLEGDLKVKQKRLDEQLTRRQDMPLLPEEDQKTLDTLMDKPEGARNDNEKKTIEQLKTKGADLNSELIRLRQKPQAELKDADKARIKELEEALNKTNTVGNALKESGLSEIQNFIQMNSEKLNKEVREAVKKIAEQKGIAIVFNSEVVLYAGQDITSDVVKDLNKK